MKKLLTTIAILTYGAVAQQQTQFLQKPDNSQKNKEYTLAEFFELYHKGISQIISTAPSRALIALENRYIIKFHLNGREYSSDDFSSTKLLRDSTNCDEKFKNYIFDIANATILDCINAIEFFKNNPRITVKEYNELPNSCNKENRSSKTCLFLN
ncbi:hypothetical protein FACS1894113_4770 [Alphaproteobacteria bacterium]|nr:hypothetical protein FACS1894113_4770 [Alphaproteobacteria bacterium]